MRDLLEANLLLDGLILATATHTTHTSVDKEKCGYVGGISGWFGALNGAPRLADG